MYSLMILRAGRSFELQQWRNFRFSATFLQKASPFSIPFSSATDSEINPRDGLKGNNFTVTYLVDSLGLAPKLAESISKKVNLVGKTNPDSVLSLLRSYGFKDSQISTIITGYPMLLVADAERSLAPKLKLLRSKGDSNTELAEIVSKVPKILRKKAGEAICVYYGFIKEIVDADKCIKHRELCHFSPQGRVYENKMRNISVLRELGMPQKLLFPLLMTNFQPVCGKEKFEESLKKVVEMGFDPKTPKFVEALRMVYGYSDKKIDEKIEAYRNVGIGVEDVWKIFKKHPIFLRYSEKKISDSFDTFLGLGFSRDDFKAMVKLYPSCMGYSLETVKTKTEFLVKKMNWKLEDLVSQGHVLGLSMERRIVPRCNVIRALMTKGLLGGELPSLSHAMAITEQVFLNRFVRKHHYDKKLVLELMAIYAGDNVSLTNHIQHNEHFSKDCFAHFFVWF